MRRYSSWNVIYQPSKLRRARKHGFRHRMATKMVVAYWQLVVVKDAKFGCLIQIKPKTSRNSRLLVFVCPKVNLEALSAIIERRKTRKKRKIMQIFDTHTHLNVEEFAGKEQERARHGQGNGRRSPQYRWFWQTDDWASHGVGRPASRTLSHAWLAPPLRREIIVLKWRPIYLNSQNIPKSSHSEKSVWITTGWQAPKRCPRKGFSSSDSIV